METWTVIHPNGIWRFYSYQDAYEFCDDFALGDTTVLDDGYEVLKSRAVLIWPS